MPKKLIISFGIVIITVLSWTGFLDQRSEAYLDEALISGGVVYATARGINAAVSVIQGTEFDAAIATFTIGEVLDPLNDLIERFSAVLLVALGSLAVQKILLEILSTPGFSYLVTGVSIGVLLTLWVPLFMPARALAIRAFVLIVASRFALTIIVLMSGYIDHTFLESEDKARHADMQDLRGSVQRLSTGKPDAPSSEDITSAQSRLEAINNQIGVLLTEIRSLNTEINLAEASVATAYRKLPTGCQLNPLCNKPSSLLVKERELEQLRSKRDTKQLVLASARKQQEELREDLNCISKQQRGESCSAWPVSPSVIKAQFDALADRVTEFSANAISLLMSMLLKTVLLPLLFLWMILAITRSALRQ